MTHPQTSFDVKQHAQSVVLEASAHLGWLSEQVASTSLARATCVAAVDLMDFSLSQTSLPRRPATFPPQQQSGMQGVLSMRVVRQRVVR